VAIEEIDSHPDFYRRTLIMISLPSLFDPTLAPPGKSVVILQCAATITSMNHWAIRKGKRTKKYKALKKEIAAQLIENVEKIIPGLSKKIDLQIESTPYTLRDYTFNTDGAAVGWTYHPREAFKGGFKGIFGQGNTPVKNLYQVGHWTMSPGGAPAGLVSGKLVGRTGRGQGQGREVTAVDAINQRHRSRIDGRAGEALERHRQRLRHPHLGREGQPREIEARSAQLVRWNVHEHLARLGRGLRPHIDVLEEVDDEILRV